MHIMRQKRLLMTWLWRPIYITYMWQSSISGMNLAQLRVEYLRYLMRFCARITSLGVGDGLSTYSRSSVTHKFSVQPTANLEVRRILTRRCQWIGPPKSRPLYGWSLMMTSRSAVLFFQNTWLGSDLPCLSMYSASGWLQKGESLNLRRCKFKSLFYYYIQTKLSVWTHSLTRD